jgi:hypothetical protein
MDKLGLILFIVGVVLAAASGFVELAWAGWVLAILGAVVGYMNVSSEGRTGFLVAAGVLYVFSTALNGIPVVGVDVIAKIMPGIVAFVGGAAFVAALLAVYETLKD